MLLGICRVIASLIYMLEAPASQSLEEMLHLAFLSVYTDSSWSIRLWDMLIQPYIAYLLSSIYSQAIIRNSLIDRLDFHTEYPNFDFTVFSHITEGSGVFGRTSFYLVKLPLPDRIRVPALGQWMVDAAYSALEDPFHVSSLHSCDFSVNISVSIAGRDHLFKIRSLGGTFSWTTIKLVENYIILHVLRNGGEVLFSGFSDFSSNQHYTVLYLGSRHIVEQDTLYSIGSSQELSLEYLFQSRSVRFRPVSLNQRAQGFLIQNILFM